MYQGRLEGLERIAIGGIEGIGRAGWKREIESSSRLWRRMPGIRQYNVVAVGKHVGVFARVNSVYFLFELRLHELDSDEWRIRGTVRDRRTPSL